MGKGDATMIVDYADDEDVQADDLGRNDVEEIDWDDTDVDSDFDTDS